MADTYAMVILSTTHTDIDKIFDYAIPNELQNILVCGMRVMVPFGFRNTKTEGYVIGVKCTTEVPINKIKYISSIMEEYPLFSETMLDLALWMKDKYYTTLSQCLQLIMPSGIKSKTDWIISLNENYGNVELTQKEKELIEFIEDSCTQSQIELEFGKNIYTVIKSLSSKGVVSLEQQTEKNNFKKTVKYIFLTEDNNKIIEEKQKIMGNKTLQPQFKVIELMEEKRSIELKEIKSYLNITDSPIKALVKKEILEIKDIEHKREIYNIDDFEHTNSLTPTQEQFSAIEFIKNEMSVENNKPILIHGITGSGKTEIYLQIIEDVLEKGKQAIVLVPEISLTPLMVGRFIGRFGKKVSVTHSRMNFGERYDQWKKARTNEISIMVGPRSALFTPFNNLGVVIIDEEHESSYKSDTTPKYDAREVAEKICGMSGATLILGSATPSLMTYYRVGQGSISLLKLNRRAKNIDLPKVFIKDMREELEAGNRSIFSKDLYNAIKENLEKKEQTILFLNRRGHSTFVSCRKCGYVMKCDNCDVSYTYHSNIDDLCCHYCGKKISTPKTCPSCGSKYIKYFGTGTQRIESEIKKLFPSSRVLRMDFDTTSKKNSHEKILSAFGNGDADILIGTQMIAKGHDFNKVTLVGIVAADLSLNTGDYRSAETTFQLITQVAGRAGRDKLEGRVFIQTYNPEHYSITLAAKQDYEMFYNEEIKIRQLMDYPPYSNIFTILLSGKDDKNIVVLIHKLYNILKYYNKKGKFQLLGPTPANISKIKNEYRWRIIIKCGEEDRLKVYAMYCIDKFKNSENTKGIFINLTMNPVIIV